MNSSKALAGGLSYPSMCGPRAQNVADFISPTPSLAVFLATNVERVPIDKLQAEGTCCDMCKRGFYPASSTAALPTEVSGLLKRRRPRREPIAKKTPFKRPSTPPTESVASASPAHQGLPLIPGLRESPDSIMRSGFSFPSGPPIAWEEPKAPQASYLSKTLLQHPQPAPPLTESPSHIVTPNKDICGIAIRVTTSGCGHVFGARCLETWILDGWCRCSVCKTTWFTKEDRVRTAMTLRENWPCRMGSREPMGLDESST